jgi:putative acetyltransferase
VVGPVRRAAARRQRPPLRPDTRGTNEGRPRETSAVGSSDQHSIRRALPAESELLFDIWWRSVCATHTFLTQDDLRILAPAVRSLHLELQDTWVLCDGAGQRPVAFLVLEGSHIEALFVAPEHLRRGAGSHLISHGRSLRGKLTVDVNEQNVAGLEFYRAQGFRVGGRSETDSAGRPFPILHLTEQH